MKKFKECDKLTLEDIKEVFHDNNNCRRGINENTTVKPEIKNGMAVFNSMEEVELYYGGRIMTLDEFFK